jgi:hypothetical protein
MTPLRLSTEEPESLTEPLLPRGVLIDELGQWAVRDWSGKSRTRAEVSERLNAQLSEAPGKHWPAGFSRWGGCASKRVEATGFFGRHHDGKRWWLVDPDGHLFWSAGVDCVRPSITGNCRGLETALASPKLCSRGTVDHFRDNLEQVFDGTWHDKWSELTLGIIRNLGFNTVANWSEWQIAKAAGFPYVRPLGWPKPTKTPRVFRDMPDAFHPDLQKDCEEFARQLEETLDDPAMTGYFLMNEPTWGFAAQTPAEGMLYATGECASRSELARRLKRKYGTDDALANAWGVKVTFEQVERGIWNRRVGDGARADLEEFSTDMVSRLFGGLSRACKTVDPNHLNLGARYHTVPPDWAVAGMDCFDVFSINCYQERVRDDLEPVCSRMKCPALIGEWHFGALDAGLPASGIGRVRDQAARGNAYRIYLEDAATLPHCVGVHWFTLYDQSALGRGDGENYNIGFVDICGRPYEALAAAARRSHERMYAVAAGEEQPFGEKPEYLAKLFY